MERWMLQSERPRDVLPGPVVAVLVMVLLGAGCADPQQAAPQLETLEQGASVSSSAANGCSSSVVQPLENQLFDEVNCIAPGALTDFSHFNVSKGFSSARLVLESNAAASLGR